MFERLDLDDAIRDIEKLKKEVSRLKYQVKKQKKELLKASEIHGAVDVQKLCELLLLCQEFIEDNSIEDKSDVLEFGQSESLRFILSVCKVVGFHKNKEECDG